MAVIPDNVKMLSYNGGTQTAAFSNDDGDGIENIKKPEVEWAKQQLCMCITLFGIFLCRHRTTTT